MLETGEALNYDSDRANPQFPADLAESRDPEVYVVIFWTDIFDIDMCAFFKSAPYSKPILSVLGDSLLHGSLMPYDILLLREPSLAQSFD